MSDEPKIAGQVLPEEGRIPVSDRFPLDPPPPPEPASFDFTVSSLTVKNPRSLWTDTDFATLAINVLAADGTVIQKYGPIAQSLGGLGKGLSINPKMSLTGIVVPDGGSMVFSFLVVNKGGWDWDSTAINALELAGSAVLGAVVQGAIVAPSATAAAADGTVTVTSTYTFALPIAIAVAAAVIAFLEGINIALADCDGTVVPGVMSIGKTELVQFAAQGSWNIICDYPGTDSADGCGANSDYSVTYGVQATPQVVVVPKVALPNIIGMSAANGVVALRAVGLVGIEKVNPADVDTPSNILGQMPAAGTMVAVDSEVTYEIKARPVITGKPGDPVRP